MARIICRIRRKIHQQRGLWRCLVLAQLAWLLPNTSTMADEASPDLTGKWLRFETTRCAKSNISPGIVMDQGCDKKVTVVATTKRGYLVYYNYLGATECFLDQAQPNVRSVRSENMLHIFRVGCSAIRSQTSIRFTHLNKFSGPENTVFEKRDIALDFEFDQRDLCKLVSLSETSHEVRSDAVESSGPRRGKLIMPGYTVDDIVSFKPKASCRVYKDETAALAE